jgi:hypothetical protein
VRNRLINVLYLLLLPALLWAANTTINRVPSTTGGGAATYNSDMSTFLTQEDANRQGELPLFPQGVIAVNGGGLHGTAAGMTSPPFATTAYTSAGNRLTQASTSINYAGQACATNGTAWVMASTQTALTIGTFRRVPGTPYYTDCSSGPNVKPPLPDDSVYLMKVTLNSAQITAVQDVAVRTIASTADACLAAATVVMPDVGDIVIDDRAGGVPVLGANPSRCQATIINNGAAEMRCAPTTLTVSAFVGVPIKAGQSFAMGIEGRQAWRCVRTTSTTTAVSIVEAISP